MEARDIFGLEALTELGSRDGYDMRPTLLRVLTDLYVHRSNHTTAEERHYTELALRLLEAVDVQTRVAVAQRLARYASPPLRVMQWLLRDLPRVAGELRAHPLLHPAAPTGAVAPSPAAGALAETAAAPREDLAAEVPRVIDPATAGKLNELFFAASAGERRLILLNLHTVAPIAATRVRVVRDPSLVRQLETAALARKREDFALHLARALYISRQQARRIAADDLGEPVVAAAKALGIPHHVLYRMLMFLNPVVGHSVARVHALAALFDEMPLPAAQSMVVIWQALRQEERMPAKHRPLAWDDAARRHARPGAALQHAPLAPRISNRRSSS
jgi:hypothetical protein